MCLRVEKGNDKRRERRSPFYGILIVQPRHLRAKPHLAMTNMQKPRIHFSSNRNVSRRSFLRGAAVAAQTIGCNPDASRQPPRRMLAICNNLGLVPEKFFPTEAGKNYKRSPYLELLKGHRNDFTVFSGV